MFEIRYVKCSSQATTLRPRNRGWHRDQENRLHVAERYEVETAKLKGKEIVGEHSVFVKALHFILTLT